MIAALYSPEQRAVHVEPLAEFVAAEAAAVRRGIPAAWRIVGVGSDDEARRIADDWARRRNVFEKLAPMLRAKRQAKEGA